MVRSSVCRLFVAAAFMTFLVGVSATSAFAEDEKITGTTEVVKDGDAVTKVSLKAGEKTYEVTLDEQGKKLGAEPNGTKVEATGTVEGLKLTVKSFKKVE